MKGMHQPFNDSVAQLVEQVTLNHWVVSSSLTGVTTKETASSDAVSFCFCACMIRVRIGLRRFSCGAEVYVAFFVEGCRSYYLEVVWGLGVGLVVPRIGGLVASDQSL